MALQARSCCKSVPDIQSSTTRSVLSQGRFYRWDINTAAAVISLWNRLAAGSRLQHCTCRSHTGSYVVVADLLAAKMVVCLATPANGTFSRSSSHGQVALRRASARSRAIGLNREKLRKCFGIGNYSSHIVPIAHYLAARHVDLANVAALVKVVEVRVRHRLFGRDTLGWLVHEH